jgi:hypothetical protein
MWTLSTLSRDDVITKLRNDIQSKIFIFRIIWNPHGFHVFDKLPNNIKMNSDYFVTKILSPFEQNIFLEEGWYIRNDLWFMSTIIRFIQVGFDILARRI